MNIIELFFQRQIDKAVKNSYQISTKDYPHLVIFSDCHRGSGNWSDLFLANKPIYEAALKHYYNRGYTYIELGDGDELWGNRNFSCIEEVHGDIFQFLLKMELEKRIILVYGNHDMEKANGNHTPFPVFYEAVRLKDVSGNTQVNMIHGHQVDFLSNQLWHIARWLVRYIWNPLELSGIKDPTSSAKNYKKRKAVESRLNRWAKENNTYLIAGHTHRPTISPSDRSWGYFNSGSCIHPNSVTCLEIDYGQISLVKWVTCSDESLQIKVCRYLLGGPRNLF